MSLMAMAVVAAALQGWTWTLYEGDGPLVLANEVPDTPQLRTVMECTPGSGVARLQMFGPNQTAGMTTLASGSATAMVQSEVDRDHRSLALRTDHPVFGQFTLTGALNVVAADDRQAVSIERRHLAKLRRFAELCGG